MLKRDSSRAGLVPLSHLRYQVRDTVGGMVRVRVRVGVKLSHLRYQVRDNVGVWSGLGSNLGWGLTLAPPLSCYG